MMRRRVFLATAFAAALACLSASAGASEPPSTGNLVVRDAWARATAPNVVVAAVYLTIEGGSTADRLLAATTPVATMTQIHTVTTTASGMLRMREADALDVPARQRITLAPQGAHLMLMNLTRPLVVGDTFEVTLQFAEAGPRVARVAVVAVDSTPPPAH